MARETYIATVQIVIHPDEKIDSFAKACDWFSGLLSEDLKRENKIIDWSYLKIGDQYMYPTNKMVD